MKQYEFNYKNSSYVFNNSPRINPLWTVAVGILLTILIFYYY